MRLLDEEVEEAAVGIPRWLVPGIGLLGLLVLLVLGLARDEWVLGAAGFGVFLSWRCYCSSFNGGGPAGGARQATSAEPRTERVAQQIAGIASALEKLRAEQSSAAAADSAAIRVAGIDFPADSPGGTHGAPAGSIKRKNLSSGNCWSFDSGVPCNSGSTSTAPHWKRARGPPWERPGTSTRRFKIN